jgi:hypothetical protein
MTPDTTKMHFGINSHPLLRALQIRVDQLPKSSLNFVAALMAARDLIPQPLCDLIYGMVAVRNGIKIGPVHQALAHLRSPVADLRPHHADADRSTSTRQS